MYNLKRGSIRNPAELNAVLKTLNKVVVGSKYPEKRTWLLSVIMDCTHVHTFGECSIDQTLFTTVVIPFYELTRPYFIGSISSVVDLPNNGGCLVTFKFKSGVTFKIIARGTSIYDFDYEVVYVSCNGVTYQAG